MNRDKKFDPLALSICLLLALAFRLPGLTVFLTADEPRSWYGRSIIFLDSLLRGDLANTGPGGAVSFIENVSLSPAPGVTTMWTGALGIILEYFRQGAPASLAQFVTEIPFDPLNPAMLFALRLPGVLVAVLAVGLTYWWSRPLLGRWGALLAAGLLALDPFYLALSRVLGHDALVATFMWLSLLAFLRATITTENSNQESLSLAKTQHSSSLLPTPYSLLPTPLLLLSGAFAGLAFLSKYPALFIGAFIAIAMLVTYLLQFRRLPHAPSPFTLHVSRFTLHLPAHLCPGLARWFTHLILWSLAAGVVFVLFWPAMWVNPLEPITTIINDALRASGSPHQKGSFFLGQPVPDPGALFYPLVAWLRTTPVVLLGLLLSLWPLFQQVVSRRPKPASEPANPGMSRLPPSNSPQRGENQPTSSPLGGIEGGLSAKPGIATSEPASSLLPTPYSVERKTFALPTPYLWAYVLLYTLLVTYGGKKQDRYLLPAFPAMTMLAAIGYTYFTHYVLRITQHYALRTTQYVSHLTWLIPTILLSLQLLLIYPAYPYYFTYYNPLAGGGPAAAKLIQVGWGEGLDQAAAYLNTLPGVESTKVTAWYSTTFEPYFKGQAIYKLEEEKISRSPKPGLAADYVVFYVNQVQRQIPSTGGLQYFQATAPVYTVTLQGIDYAWVYPSVGMQHVLVGEVRLVGQAELLGYDLVDEAGQPVTTAYPESVVFLSLYWEWQGKAEDEPIQISLVDAEGNTRGWGNAIQTFAPAPYAEWQEGMVARDDFALVIFADTLPGEYRLSAWIDRPATGETVGVFPLEDEVMIPVAPRETQ